MGKGNRNSQKRAQDKIQNADQLLAMQKAKSKKSIKDKAITITIAVIALVIVATLAFSALSNTGIFIRNTSVMASDDITVDAAMMSFFLNESIMNFYGQYGMYIQYGLINVDFTQDLKTQKYNATSILGSFSGSWYDYFMKPVKSQVETYIVYASAAKLVKEKDLSLTDEQKKEIDTTIKNIKDNLSLRSLSWSDWYGKGVKESDARRCYELIYLASNFATYYREKLEGEVKEDEIIDYREENKSLFYTADCLTFTIEEKSKGMTDEEYDEACKVAKAAADAIAQAKSPEQFVEFVEKYKASVEEDEETGTDTDTETDTDTDTDTETESETETETEKTMEDKIEDYKDTIKYEEGTGNDLNDFLFGNDETGSESMDAAEEGDATVIEETGEVTEKETTSNSGSNSNSGKSTDTEDSDTEDSDSEESDSDETETDKKDNGTKKYKTYKVTVYYVIDPMHYDTEPTHDFAYLISDERQNIFDFDKAFKAAEGDKTADLFIEIAEKQYNAIHESEDHEHSENEIFAYRKLEKQAAGWFYDNSNKNNGYKVMDAWLESADRKDGDLSQIIDLKIVSTDSSGKATTSEQFAIIFFTQHNDETWYVTAFDGAVTENFNEWYEDWLKENNLKVDDSINNLDTKKSVLTLSAALY